MTMNRLGFEDLIALVRAGAGVTVDVGMLTQEQSLSLARAAKEGSRLVLRNTGSRTAADLLAIARAGSAAILFQD